MANKKNTIYIVLFSLLGVGFVYFGFWRKWQLETKHEIGVARVYHYSSGGRGNAGTLSVDFITVIEGKEFKSSSAYLLNDFNCNNNFIGKTFPVVYNRDNPSISSILIIPSDFARYNYPYPDSLSWVKKFIK